MKSSAAAGWIAVKGKICQQQFSRSDLSNLGEQMQNTLSAKVDKSIFADSSFSCLSNVFGQTTHLF